MNSTPLKDLCLVEWLDDGNDSSSASSPEEVNEARDTIASAAPLASTTSRDLYDQCGEQEPEVIVISSGEESSDVDDEEAEAEDDDRHTTAETAITSELLLTNDNNNSNLHPALDPSRHATPPAECRLPVELNGIFATAINKLQDPNTESVQSVYQTLAFIEQQDERDRQRKSSTLSGIEQQIAPLQRVDSGMAPLGTAIIVQGEPEEMDISLNCRSLEEAELDRSRAAMARRASSAVVEQEEDREERQEDLQHERQNPMAQPEEIETDMSNQSQALQGVLRNKDKVKTDRTVRLTEKKQRKALALRRESSGRTQLLNMRSQLAAEQIGSRTLDSNSKSKLARRNKQVRRNKVKQKKQNRAADSRT